MSYVEELEAALAHVYVLGCGQGDCPQCLLHKRVYQQAREPNLSPEARHARVMAGWGFTDDPNEVARGT